MDPKDNPLLDPSKYNIPSKRGKVIKPIHEDIQIQTTPVSTGANQAAALLKDKINRLYENEPNAKEELAEAEAAGKHRSKHQQYMHDLSTSGKSLAEIQTAWHSYYQALPDKEKHEVWQEFYTEHSRIEQQTAAKGPEPSTNKRYAESMDQEAKHKDSASPIKPDPRTVGGIKSEIRRHVRSRNNAKRGSAKHSLLFGLAMGGVVALFMLFGLFNERFVAPFITPSKSVSNTPIIIDPSSTAVGPESKIIIPKINVEIPIVFDEPSIEEEAVQKALENGVIHYATTSKPGEQGNGAIFGHSSNNILNKGKYKFAFVLLKRLESGDVFYVQKDGKRYAYRVYKKSVVTPEEVSVLDAQEKPSTMSLITCDPPGTSTNRLVVVGEQISPDPNANIASSAKQNAAIPATLPSDAPSLWSRFTTWLSS